MIHFNRLQMLADTCNGHIGVNYTCVRSDMNLECTFTVETFTTVTTPVLVVPVAMVTSDASCWIAGLVRCYQTLFYFSTVQLCKLYDDGGGVLFPCGLIPSASI